MTEDDRSQGSSGPHPWTEPFDVLLRWRRYVLLGIGATWTIVLGAVIVVPARVVCQATLVLPNVSYADVKHEEDGPDKPSKPGIPIGYYKKLEASVSDAALLEAAFKDRLTKKKLSDLSRDLKSVLTPLTSGARDEIARTDKEDTVTAVRVTYADSEPKRAELVVNTLLALIRNEVVALAAQDRIEAAVLEATVAARAALARKLELTAKIESLQELATDLQKLSSLTRTGDEGRREVVDVKSGGHRYLPPAVQLVGARALQADDANEMRLAGWRFRVESLRVAFFRRLDTNVRQASQSADSRLAQDLPSLIDAEAQAFFAKRSGPESGYVRSEVEGLRDVLQSHSTTTAFVQSPSLRSVSRAPWIVASLVGSTLAVLLAALLAESWRQYHQSARQQAG